MVADRNTNAENYDPAYNARKAAQIIGFLLSKEPMHSMDPKRAMVLVYLADRESMMLYGYPMLSEPRCSMAFGPVNARTSTFAMGHLPAPQEWDPFIALRNGILSLVKGLSCDYLDELSKADIIALSNVWDKFGAMQMAELQAWAEDGNLPEWNPSTESHPISLIEIMETLGFDDPKGMAAEIEYHEHVSRVFNKM